MTLETTWTYNPSILEILHSKFIVPRNMKCPLLFLLISIASSSVQTATLAAGHLWQALLQLPAPTSPKVCVIRSAANLDRALLKQIFGVFSSLETQQVILSTDKFDAFLGGCTHFLVTFSNLNWELTEDILARLADFTSWNNRAYFVFMSESAPSWDSIEHYAGLMRVFGITNSALVGVEFKSGQRYLYGYGYFDYALSQFDLATDLVSYLQNDHLRDVGGYPFHAMVMQWFTFINIILNPLEVKGSFAELIKVFCQHVNASLQWHLVGDHPQFDKVFNEFVQNRYDIIPIISWHHGLMQQIYDDEFQSLVLLIPETSTPSYFKHLGIPFTFSVWILVLILMIVSIILNIKFEKLFPRNLILTIFFGSATPEHQLKKVERFVVMSLAVIAFLLNEAYIAKMVSFMLNVRYEKHQETLNEFKNTSIPLCVIDEPNQKTYSKIPIVRLIYKNFSEMWYDDDSCTWLVTYRMAELFLTSEHNHDPWTQRRRFYILPQRFEWTPLTHTMSRMAPFVERFVTVQRRIIEAGMWHRWTELAKKIYRVNRALTTTVFEFDDLLPMWQILLYGCLLSSVVFIGELSFDKVVKTVKKLGMDLFA